MIPDEAVEAAARSMFGGLTRTKWEDVGPFTKRSYHKIAREALEAALPTLLSHEREETRLAHLDAVVNAATVDRLEKRLAEVWDEGRKRGPWIDENPYREGHKR